MATFLHPRFRLNLGSPWHQVPIQLQGLCDDLADWKKNWPDVIEQAAHRHHRAVLIHPFPNGNGRWSRLLANIWLKLHKQPLTDWPEEVIGSTSLIRDEYLAAVRAADEGDYARLINVAVANRESRLNVLHRIRHSVRTASTPPIAEKGINPINGQKPTLNDRFRFQNPQ